MNKIILLLTLLISSVSALSASPEMVQNENTGPIFRMENYIRTSSVPDSGIIQISLRIPYRNLLFLKKGNHFEAHADISVNILSDKERVGGFSDLQTLSLPSIDPDVLKKKELRYNRNFLLPYGKYQVSAVITDIATQKKRRVNHDCDLTILDTKNWSMGALYVARTPDALRDSTSRQLSFGFSASGYDGPQNFSWEIQNINGKSVRKGSISINLKKEAGEYYFSVSVDSLQYRGYTMVVRTTVEGEDFRRSIPFQVRWSGMNNRITNLEEAVQQMRYLMMTNYMSRQQYQLLDNSSGEMKKNNFLEYWKSVDPTPGTDANELMNEYFRRINESNAAFSTHRPGWESDRGMIYTLLGPPDDREVHNFDINTKAYVVWYYYSLNKYFVFIDYTGFGDYQLDQPVSETLY